MTQSSTQNPSQSLVQISDSALQQVKQLLQEEISKNSEIQGLRLGVQGGGCSGFSYKLSFDAPNEKDHQFELDSVRVFIDPKSAIYLKGIFLDYQGGLEGKGFVFQNPNATSTCGCGESFSI